MIVSGDWITPQVIFLLRMTKPPLTQWLEAAVFTVAGPTEWARIVTVLAAMKP